MKLQVQELVPPLSAEEPGPLTSEGALPAEPSIWHDSSIELERGLDVFELSVDLNEYDAAEPDLPSLHPVHQRR